MTTIDLPYLDLDGSLSRHTIAAVEAGAIAASHPTDSTKITLTFSKDGDANVFLKAAGLADAPASVAPEPDEPTG